MKITIKNKFASATIDTLGAELKSWIDNNGKEYMWSGDPAYWGGVSPLLFPMISNLRNGKTMINGKEYEIPKHGIVRREEFQVIEQKEDKAVFSISYTEESLKAFPFPFNLRLTYELKEDILSMVYDVYNLGDQEMYFHIGAHPAFQCPMFEGEKFSDYVLKFEQKETSFSPVYDLKNSCISNENRICRMENSDTLAFDYPSFENDALIFDDLKSRKVSLINPAHGKGVEVDFNSFDVIAFWNPNNEAPFLCIEPWNGSAIYSDEDNEFKNKRCIQTAEPFGHKSYELKMRILN